MVGTTFKFNEAKIIEDGQYTVEQLHEKVDLVASKNLLTKERPGQYLSDIGVHDFALVGRAILNLKDEPWFINNISEWLLHIDGNTEDILAHYAEGCHG